MSDAIAPTDSVAPNVASVIDYELNVDEASKNQHIADQMSVAMDQALERALSDPLDKGASELAQDALTGISPSEVTDLKTGLVSESQTTQNNAEGSVDVAQEVAGVLRDLTEWQVTWNVAQTAQRDITHILKSG